MSKQETAVVTPGSRPADDGEQALSRDYINALPAIHFEGEIVLIDTPQKAADILSLLLGEKRIGFDTESKPSFTRGVSHPVCLVQLATEQKAFLIQLFKTGFPPALVELLNSPRVMKVGVGLENDITKLRRWHPFRPAAFHDLGKVAAALGIPQLGARSLTARFLNHRLIKSSQRTDWSRPQLTEKQMIYAATDAWVCMKIYPFLSAELLAEKTKAKKN
jgi:ribonuclease D